MTAPEAQAELYVAANKLLHQLDLRCGQHPLWEAEMMELRAALIAIRYPAAPPEHRWVKPHGDNWTETPLYAAPPDPLALIRDEQSYKDVVLDLCAILHLEPAATPRQTLASIVDFEITMALDPTVSTEARDLIRLGLEAAAKACGARLVEVHALMRAQKGSITLLADAETLRAVINTIAQLNPESILAQAEGRK